MLLKRIRRLVSIFRGYLLVLFGTGFARILSFATAVILARTLGSASFGEVSVFLAFLGFWVGSDFLDQTFVRYANAPDRDAPVDYLRAVFVLKIALNAVLLFASFPVSRLLATTAFDKPSLTTPIFAALACGVGLNFLSLRAATHQAKERFGYYTATTASFYVLSFLAVVAVVLAVAGDALLPIYAAYVGVATLVGAYAFLRLMRSVRNLMFDKRLVKVIVTFSRWLFAANVAYIAFQRLDVFLLTAFASLPDVGEYSAGLRVVQIVSLLTGTLAPALLPRATQATQAAPLLRAYLKQSAGLSLVIAILASAVWIAAPMIVTLFFGSQYRDAATVTRVFLIGTVLVAIYTPLSQLLLGYTQPRRVFYLAVLKLCVIGGSGVLLVPRLAGPGAALAVTLSEAAALLYVLLALRRRILAAFVQPRPATIS